MRGDQEINKLGGGVIEKRYAWGAGRKIYRGGGGENMGGWLNFPLRCPLQDLK